MPEARPRLTGDAALRDPQLFRSLVHCLSFADAEPDFNAVDISLNCMLCGFAKFHEVPIKRVIAFLEARCLPAHSTLN